MTLMDLLSFIHTYAHTWTCVHIHISIYLHNIHAYMCIHTYTYINIYIYMYKYIFHRQLKVQEENVAVNGWRSCGMTGGVGMGRKKE